TDSTVLAGQYKNEKKNSITADGILRFRITDNLWFPIDIKYDPQKGKVFGLFDIKYNFDGLGKKLQALARE
ncbi:MAG TPA: hypothetical protein VGI61_00670, partial [Parafilimonas sp.]